MNHGRHLQANAPHVRVGRQGECIAITHLRARGLWILDRNVRLGKGEIDIIALDRTQKILVFVEVKSRSNSYSSYDPELNWTRAKRMHLVRAARRWINRYRYEGGCRMDLVCIAGGRVVRHLQDLPWR